MFEWLKKFFNNDIKHVQTPKNRDFILNAIGYACLGGVEPHDCGVEGNSAILSLFRVIKAPTDWIKDVEQRLKFCKMTEHLVGYHFSKDDLRPKNMTDEVYNQYLDNNDQRFLNKVWGTLMYRKPADTVPTTKAIALKQYPKPFQKFIHRDRKHVRRAFQIFLEDSFYKKLEHEFATVQ